METTANDVQDEIAMLTRLNNCIGNEIEERKNKIKILQQQIDDLKQPRSRITATRNGRILPFPAVSHQYPISRTIFFKVVLKRVTVCFENVPQYASIELNICPSIDCRIK
ncbi:unnamed protein product [Rotaria socialis]